jgi:hypothetical protein
MQQELHQKLWLHFKDTPNGTKGIIKAGKKSL